MGIIADTLRAQIDEMRREDEIRTAKILATISRIHKLAGELAEITEHLNESNS